MDNRHFTEEFNSRFSEEIIDIEEHNQKRITIKLEPEALLRATYVLLHEKEFRFIIASGLHSKQGFEILYHFSYDATGHIVNLRVMLPHQNPAVDSLTKLSSGAEWIEREIHELLGIHFKGHPNLVPLLSGDNWPEGTYPYRKDFK